MSLDASIKNDLNHSNLLQEAQLAPIYQVPLEIFMHIFGFLTKEDLGNAAQVCKIWNQWVATNFLSYNSDLKTQFPLLKIIDKTVWEAHIDLNKFGLNIIDEQPLDKHTDIPTLKNLISSLEGKIEKDAGLTLITIPKNLDLNKLLVAANNPKQGNAIKCTYWDRITKEFGDKSVSKTARFVFTNNILRGSKNKSFEQQKSLAEDLGLEMPELLPTITLIFMTFISSQEKFPTRLFNDDPGTYTRLKEKIEDWHLVAGGFVRNGLNVDFEDGSANISDGVGGFLKF